MSGALFGGATGAALAAETPACQEGIKETTELEACASRANTHTGAFTIKLKGGQYTPEKQISLSNKSGTITIEELAGSGEVTIQGSALPSENPELLVIKEGVSVVLKNFVIAHSGHSPAAAIEDVGSIELEGMTVAGNGGAALLVQPQGTGKIVNSTLANNTSVAFVNGGTTNLLNDTIAFNKEGGAENLGTLNITNTIIAENPGGDCSGLPLGTDDHSLDSDGSCGAGVSTGKGKAGVQNPAFNDGGPTVVNPLKHGSPAIEAADMTACPSTDQSGHPRPDSGRA